MSKAGSTRKLVLAGISFNVMADSDANKTSGVLNEANRHSGGSSQKQTLLPGDINSVTVDASTAEVEQLETLAKSVIAITMSLTYADGSVYSSPGFINLAEHTSQDNKIDVTMFPSSGVWSRFGL